MPPPSRPDALESSGFWKTYMTVPGDIDLVADGGGPCRLIRTGGAGNLVCTRSAGGNETIPDSLAGEPHPVQATKIIASGTTATKITVYW